MDLSGVRVLLIGCGNMGGALARGWLALDLGGLALFDIDASKSKALAEHAGGKPAASLESALPEANIVILAIKPQGLPQFLAASGPLFHDGQLLISILAGTSIGKLREGIPADIDIVRAMPNTPAMVDEGITALCGGSQKGREVAEQLFDCVGEVLSVDESMMDAVTAVSGSGPAYVFYFIEALTAAAQARGFSPEDARTLVYQTVRGALTLLEETGQTPEELRRTVTSPGGTTQAAIEAMQRLGLADAVAQGVAAAAERSRDLGK